MAIRGSLTRWKSSTCESKSRRTSLKAELPGEGLFSSIDNDFGSAFIHVGSEHIQVIVTVRGKEVFRNVWSKEDGEQGG